MTDVGRLNDKSFNETSWDGVQQAQQQLGVDVNYIETADPKDYAKNIQQFVSQNYDVIVTVGLQPDPGHYRCRYRQPQDQIHRRRSGSDYRSSQPGRIDL